MIITVRCNKNGFLKADRLQRWLCIHVFSGGNRLEIFLKRHLNVYLMLETFHWARTTRFAAQSQYLQWAITKIYFRLVRIKPHLRHGLTPALFVTVWSPALKYTVNLCLCASQAHRSFGSKETQQSSPREEDEHHEEEEEEEEEEPPVPMTTRLRKQAERAQERVREQRTVETIIVSDAEDDVGCPSQWNVEQVFSYISTLPGNAVFHTPEAQLLLLTVRPLTSQHVCVGL